MALADGIPTLCWLARADGYIFWYNKRWHEYCGSTPEAMQGWGWQSVHDPDELPHVMERWTNSIATGEPFEMVFPLRGADGVFRPFLTRIVPLRGADGAVVRWLGVNTEVGDRIRAEQALERSRAALANTQATLAASEASFKILTDAMPQMVWSTLPDGFHDYYNKQWYEFTGVPEGSTDGEAWNGMFHPEDQERAWARWRHSLATGAPYEIEYRLRHRSGAYRWTLGRALPVRNEAGEIVRWIGTCTDIDDAKRAAEQNELLSRELSHRIKNIFAVIVGLIGLSARRDPAVQPFARELSSRVTALGRAHEFARPHSDMSKPDFGEASLHSLLRELLTPYDVARFQIEGVDTSIDDRGATPIALLFHELATNAAKYGALSEPAGAVSVSIKRDGDDIVLDWIESGGPKLMAAPTHRGFGTQLAEMAVVNQLGGAIEREWLGEGLRVLVRTPAASLYRG